MEACKCIQGWAWGRTIGQISEIPVVKWVRLATERLVRCIAHADESAPSANRELWDGGRLVFHLYYVAFIA